MTAASLTARQTNVLPGSSSARRIISLLSAGPAFGLHTSGSAERKKLEAYIAQQFQAVHRAQIQEFLPYLLSLRCTDHFTAVAGIRPASEQKLFLERYLSLPVEREIQRIGGTETGRGEIAEIGNLAATQRGFSHLLFLLLTAVLDKSRFEWVVFTATPVVQKTLRHLGFELHVLAEADPATLGETERSDWGSYYDCLPQVVAGHVASAAGVIGTRRRHKAALAMYSDRIQAVAAELDQQGGRRGLRAIAA